MIVLTAAAVAALVAGGFRAPGGAWAAAAAAGVLVWSPGPAITGAALVTSAAAWRRFRAARRREEELDDEVALLGELTMLGVTAGLSFVAALSQAGAEVAPELRREVAAVIARSRVDGHAVAFAAAGGRAGELYRLAGRALATGAPLARSLDVFVTAARDRSRARRLAAARRLPIRLLVPLTLLILPGFVLLTAGPALLTGLERLGT